MSLFCSQNVLLGITWYTSSAARGGAGSFKNLSIYKSEEQVPIEIVFDMLGFNMLNPKMKNHPPFVLPRLSNMQRSQHTKLLRRNKDSFWNFLACLSYSNESNLKDLPSTTLYYKVLVQYYSVLQSPVLLCTTKYYSSTTLYYTVLLQYYSVLQSTTPLLLCTTQCYSTTTLYYKLLLQYYSVLQSTTPVLLCTTQCYSSTTLYYKVPLHYYFVLHSATPLLLCTTNYYSSTTLYYKVLLQYYSVLHSTTPVLLQYYSVLQSTTPVLLRTTQYYSSTTPVLLCTTKYYSGTRKYCSSTTPVLQSTTPVTTNLYYKVPSHMKRYLQRAEQQESASNFRKYCACHEKWLSWSILFTHETLFTMRGATRVSLQLQQVLRLPRKMTLVINPLHTWNAIYNARSNTCHCPNSPNTAPATKNESHDWSLSHMKRYLQCAEQHVPLSKLTKYCACHEK